MNDEHVYEDKGADRPLIILPGYESFGTDVPGKCWCWTHAKWEDLPDA